MAYTPNPLDPTQPVGNVLVATLTAELRALKSRLVTDKDDIESIEDSISTIENTISDIEDQVATNQSTRFALLTNTFNSVFTVPSGITELTVIAVGGGMGGWGGFGCYPYNTGKKLQDGETSYFGNCGESKMQTMAVSGGQEITYACGAGGNGGNAAGGNFPSDFYNQVPRRIYRTYHRCIRNENGNLGNDPNRTEQPGFVINQHRGNANTTGNQGSHVSVLHFQIYDHSSCGKRGLAGGDTTFGNITANGGSFNLLNDSPLYQQPFTALGQFGAGGPPGNNRIYTGGSITQNFTNGGPGEDGAILVMW